MKKLIGLLALATALVCLLASCGHTHYFEEWEVLKPATCTEKGEKVRYCYCGEAQTVAIYALGHNYVDGVCDKCGNVESTDEPDTPDAPETPCAHNELTVLPAASPTCTETGLTEGKKCSACDKIIIAQTTVDALGHTEVIDAAVEPTCTETGLTKGKHCSVCNEVIVMQDVIPANGHNFDNRLCSVCNAWDVSEGLEFTSNGDGTCYLTGIGTCTDSYVIIPDYSPEGDKVVRIHYSVFRENTNITSVRISNNVTSIAQYAFSDCPNLEEIIFPERLTELERYAFQKCTSLESVTIPTGLEMIGGAAFYGCTSLVNVTIPDSVTYFEASVFNGCTALESIIIPASVTKIDIWAFKDCSSLESIFFMHSEEQFASITIDPEYAYLSNAKAYCYLETEPTQYGNYWHYVDGIPTPWLDYYSATLSFISNGDGTCNVSIGNCTDTKIIIPEISPQGYIVTGIQTSAFSYASVIEVIFPSTLKTIGVNAFGNCRDLKSVIIPNGVTTIGEWAFLGCTSLESIVIPSSVKTIDDYAFNNCNLLSTVYYLGDKEDIKNLSIGVLSPSFEEAHYYFYSENTPATSGDFWHWVDGVPTVWTEYAPAYSEGLEYTSNGDETCSVSIGTCTDTNIVISPVSPEGDSVTSISNSAFEYCESLTSIVIPYSVTSIGPWAFDCCYNLTDVYYTGDAEKWSSIEIGASNSYLMNATIHYNYVPEE